MKRLLVAVLLLLVAWPAALGLVGVWAKPAPADVGIVFGSLVKDGQPSVRLTARLEAARSLYASGLVRYLIVSGAKGREGYDEARVMRHYLLSHGVPDSVIVTDPGGHNTSLTAEDSAIVMRLRGWRTADVVTQYFHVARAQWACEHRGIRVVGAAVPRFFEPRDAYSIAREAVALPVYMCRG